MNKLLALLALSTASVLALNCGVTISEPIEEEGGGSPSSSLDACGCPWTSEHYGRTSSVGVTTGGYRMLHYDFETPGVLIECTDSSCTCSAPTGSCSCTWDGTQQPCCGMAPTTDCSAPSTSGGCDTSVSAATSSGAGGADTTVSVTTSAGAGGCGAGGSPPGTSGAGGDDSTSVASSSSTGFFD